MWFSLECQGFCSTRLQLLHAGFFSVEEDLACISPHTDSGVSACSLSQDGHSLLHSERKGQTRQTGPQEDRHSSLSNWNKKVSSRAERKGITFHIIPCSEDKTSFNNVLEAVKTNYNDRFEEIRRKWGGGIMGVKAQAARAKLEKLKMKELAQKM